MDELPDYLRQALSFAELEVSLLDLHQDLAGGEIALGTC